jgi:hypothetical protein
VAHRLRLKDSMTASEVDRYYFEYLEGEWCDLPEIEREWASWEEMSRLNFVLEWPMREDRLHMLERLASEGRLTSAQVARLERLRALVREHRPIVERLLSEDDPTIPRRPAR